MYNDVVNITQIKTNQIQLIIFLCSTSAARSTVLHSSIIQTNTQ